jgi:hypothetical protein
LVEAIPEQVSNVRLAGGRSTLVFGNDPFIPGDVGHQRVDTTGSAGEFRRVPLCGPKCCGRSAGAVGDRRLVVGQAAGHYVEDHRG